MNFKTLELTVEGALATIALNRPDAANGMSLELTTELAIAAKMVSENTDLKALILTGKGRFFSAGGDINAMASADHGAGVEVGLIAAQLHKALALFAAMDIPFICAVNGTAAGAGFSTAVAADLVVAAKSAKFTMAYTKVGLSPDGSASYYLPRLIGLRKTQELMFTNRVLSAQEAMDWGLVTTVVEDEDLMAAALALAANFIDGSKTANTSVKALLRAAESNSLEQQLDLESEFIAKNAESDDGKEGVSAFLEKRKPSFM